MTYFKMYLVIILLAILVIGITAIANRYFREIKAAQQKIDSLGSQVIETANGPIEYVRVGEGYPVLVVNGSFGGFDQGLVVAEPLIEAGYQVISVSRFGYLRSPMPDNASVDKQVDAFICLLDTLGIQKVAVLTVSGGAVSSTRFAASYPQRISVLILQSPAAPGKVIVTPPPKMAITMMRSNFIYWAMVTYMRPVILRMIGVPESFLNSPESEGATKDILESTLPSGGRMDGFYFDNYGVDTEFHEEISDNSPYSVTKIKLPVLVINALDDPIAVHVNVKGMAEKFPNASLFVVPDGGHILLGHSEEVKKEIIKFLSENGITSNDK
jgi:pimeloyl-ACP methyl ester carboxylesterase